MYDEYSIHQDADIFSTLSLNMVRSLKYYFRTCEGSFMEAAESEELNPLQIFLLVLVDFGLATPYDLLSKAGLGPGLTSPALKRLKEAGLLTGTPGPRNRLRYAITEKGVDRLQESLRAGQSSYWQLGQTDVFESLPRGIILAWLHSGSNEAHRGALRAAENLSVLARRKQREAEDLRDSMLRLRADTVNHDSAAANGILVGTAYQWIKAECDAALFRLQADVTTKIIELLAELPIPPRGRHGIWSDPA
jgi:DNA-binding PadR family transcriptional regulator